ncbi:MAG: hypothetical protein Pars2KO_26040 [Parasphingorhabdus sp.]
MLDFAKCNFAEFLIVAPIGKNTYIFANARGARFPFMVNTKMQNYCETSAAVPIRTILS